MGYKVVKEALIKSEKIHAVFFEVIVNTHEVVAKSKRVKYKPLSIIGEINTYFQDNIKHNARTKKYKYKIPKLPNCARMILGGG